MRIFLLTGFFLAFAPVAEAGAGSVKWEDVVFYGNTGTYELGSVQEKFYSEYDLPKHHGVIVLATSSDSNEKYRKQYGTVSEMSNEVYLFLSVVANSNKKAEFTYHTDKETADRLLAGSDYRLLVIDREGSLSKDCSCVLNKWELVRAID